MIGALLRVVLVIVVIAAVAAFFIGYRVADREPSGAPENAVGTSGSMVNVEGARETGAEIGEQVALGADRAQRLAADAALTAKIKSKMALDDTVTARSIDVDTAGATVTLSGTVGSQAEHDRAVRLARETDGVATVVDRLTVR